VTCTNPYVLIKGPPRHEVPCGKCVPCRIARARVWATRCVHESAFHEKNAFVTLTYADENLPPDNSVSKDELQRYFKRLRKSLGTRRIRYYACGEYGEKNGRPHYHAIVFGMSPWKEDKELLEDAWRRGFITTGTVTYDSARYVAEYISKDYDGELAEKVYGSRSRPFKLCSGGLGKGYAVAYADQIKKGQGTTIRGVHVQVPRYYLKKANASKAEVLALTEIGELYQSDRFKAIKEKFLKQGKPAENSDVLTAIIDGRMQRSKTMLAKKDLHKKGNL